VATLYSILGSVSTVELIGGSSTRPVRLITARAEPSGVVFTFRVAPADFVASHVALIAHDIAQRLNIDAAVPGVVDLTVYLDVNQQGQYVYKATATVESSSGDSSADVAVPYNSLWDDRFDTLIERERANLDAIEAL
jgi:hypothetical protein